MPDENLMKDILKQGEVIKKRLDRGENINILFGCAAGKSRSTAACYVILCYLLGEWNEREALNLLVNKRPIARPNALMVKIADDLMKRGYKMVAPLHNALDLERETEDDGLLLF